MSSNQCPQNLAENLIEGVKKIEKNLAIFVSMPIKPLGKIFRTQKQIAKIFFPLGATRA